MDKKRSKSGIIATSIITIALLVVLTLLTFAIPFPKIDQSVLLVVYLCSASVIALEGGLIIGLFFGKGKPNSKILGLPIAYFGFLVAAVQVLVTALFYALNAFIQVPLWIPCLIEALLCCFLVIQLTLGFFFKARNAEYHESKANTAWMDSLRCQIRMLAQNHREGELGKALEGLSDLVMGSDPVGNSKSSEAEREIDDIVSELKAAFEKGSIEREMELIEKACSALKKRNALCKLGK